MIKFLALLIIWIFIPVIFYATQIEQHLHASWLAPLLGLGFIYYLKVRNSLILRLTARSFLHLSILIFLVSRVIWLVLITTVPSSDFADYNDLANLVALGKPMVVGILRIPGVISVLPPPRRRIVLLFRRRSGASG